MSITSAPVAKPLVIWEPSATAPAGYVKANGAALSRTVYAWLFARIGTAYGVGDGATTFNVPDLRAEFLRGLDDGRGVDAARVLGSAQESQNLAHTHGGASGAGGTHSHSSNAVSNVSGGTTSMNTFNGGAGGNATAVAPNHTHTIASDGGAETRPRNVAGLYCIAYAP